MVISIHWQSSIPSCAFELPNCDRDIKFSHDYCTLILLMIPSKEPWNHLQHYILAGMSKSVDCDKLVSIRMRRIITSDT